MTLVGVQANENAGVLLCPSKLGTSTGERLIQEGRLSTRQSMHERMLLNLRRLTGNGVLPIRLCVRQNTYSPGPWRKEGW